MAEVPRSMRHPPRRTRPAEWELLAELEFWRDLSGEGTAVTIPWCLEVCASIEAELDARRERTYKRVDSAYDTRDLKRRVKEAADIVAVFGSRVPESMGRAPAWGLKRQIHICCPFHPDSTPSLVLYVDQQTWWCFSCQQGGDAISAAMLLDNLDYVPALETLAKEFGVEIPKAGKRLRLKAIE